MTPTLLKIQKGDLPIHSQVQSRFFHLPYEIRALIYDAVFTPNIIHLVPQDDPQNPGKPKLRHIWFAQSFESIQRGRQTRLIIFNTSASTAGIHATGTSTAHARISAFRAVNYSDCPWHVEDSYYSETIDLVYSRHTFSFNESGARSYFWTFYRIVPIADTPANLRLEYTRAWEAIAGLPRLRSLFVTLSDDYLIEETWHTLRIPVVAACRALQQQLDTFDVVLFIDRRYFPIEVHHIIAGSNLLWEAFEMDMDDVPGWDTVNPACRFVGLNVKIFNAEIGRYLPAESDLIDWVYQFSSMPVEWDGEPRETELAQYRRWEGAQDDGRPLERAEARMRAVEVRTPLKHKYRDFKHAMQFDSSDLEAINRAADMLSATATFEYLWRYPQLPGTDAPVLKQFWAA
ncbi:hypothetical protein BJY04DRAFT_217947 [Aspergillus karnatakaensis]|uniref:uncharacterized protein n=1 Tax=Aspergillus karnatakaensis TaxID=1810916 RepID=UPI003CCCE7B7